MSSYFTDIRAAIKEVIDTATEIKSAYDYERSTFDGFPACIIAPSDNSADYSSTERDRLRFVFKVRIYHPIKNEADHSAAEVAIGAAFDEVLGLFSKRSAISACDWLEPAPSAWYYETRSEAVYRVAEITLRCVKHVSIIT